MALYGTKLSTIMMCGAVGTGDTSGAGTGVAEGEDVAEGTGRPECTLRCLEGTQSADVHLRGIWLPGPHLRGDLAHYSPSWGTRGPPAPAKPGTWPVAPTRTGYVAPWHPPQGVRGPQAPLMLFAEGVCGPKPPPEKGP